MLLIVCVFGTIVGAQTIYQPVQFEYGRGEARFYYGGSDPTVFARAERETLRLTAVRPGSTSLPIRTFSNALPYQPNAAVFGYTANDAKNDAYRALPRYYCMQVSSVRREPLLPASTGDGRIEIKPYVRPSTRPARW